MRKANFWITLIFALMVLPVTGCSADECAYSDGRSLEVCPGVFDRDDVVVLKMAERHPSGLAIMNPNGEWIYVVFPSIEYEFFDGFAAASELSFKAGNLVGMKSFDGELREVKVFDEPGEYLFYLADDLETEPENTFSQRLIAQFISTKKN